MNYLVEISNETQFQITGVQELIEDFLKQLNYSQDTEISIVFCGNEMIQTLNKNYREKDYPTDVLSFPAELDYFLGDIVISVEKAKEQAEVSLVKEIEMLLAHGLLHLLGYDHENSEEEYKEMIDLQNTLLKNKNAELMIK